MILAPYKLTSWWVSWELVEDFRVSGQRQEASRPAAVAAARVSRVPAALPDPLLSRGDMDTEGEVRACGKGTPSLGNLSLL